MDKLDPREKILLGSEELFHQHGVKNLSMDEIARHLGVSKKTIYIYFKDKQDLLTACVRNHFLARETAMKSLHQQNLPAIEEYFYLMDEVSNSIREHTSSLLMIQEIKRYYPEVWGIFREFKQKCILNSVENNLRNGINEGVYRPEIDVAIIARIRGAEMEAISNPEIFPHYEFHLPHLFDQLLMYHLYGICTPKGAKKLISLLNKKHKIENP